MLLVSVTRCTTTFLLADRLYQLHRLVIMSFALLPKV